MAIEVNRIDKPDCRWKLEDKLLVRHVQLGCLGILTKTGALSHVYGWMIIPFSSEASPILFDTQKPIGCREATSNWVPLPCDTEVTLKQEVRDESDVQRVPRN